MFELAFMKAALLKPGRFKQNLLDSIAFDLLPDLV
jgi:hypothetical protein